MGDVHADIKPSGFNQRQEVDIITQLTRGLDAVCAKLDLDGGITATTFQANAITACMTCRLKDSKNNAFAGGGLYQIGPNGISSKARINWMYQWYNAMETLCEQLDADGDVADADYEANCYTAMALHKVRINLGTLGDGNFTFTPGGDRNIRQLADFYYNQVNALETLTEQLDGDGGVTDVNYEALCYTAIVLTKVKNSAGSLLGN